MTVRLLYVLLLLFFSALVWGQPTGGTAAYQFLNLPTSAAAAALGGHHIAVMDDDLSLAARNPALLNARMHRRAALSHGFVPAGISNSYLGYALHRPELKMTFQAALQYTGYGSDLVRRDNTGADQGTFSAGDAALILGASRTIEGRINVGANLKVINSQLAGYGSLAVGFDAGVHYQDTSGLFQISLVARNFGRQLTTYDEVSGREPMPFELQVGIARELRYLPFRFSVTYRYLDRWNVLYDDPDQETGLLLTTFGADELQERGAGSIFFDNFARHFVFGGELLLGKRRNFRARVGYNHGLRRELRRTDFRSAAGYSFGFAFQTRRFGVEYGRTIYHLGRPATRGRATASPSTSCTSPASPTTSPAARWGR